MFESLFLLPVMISHQKICIPCFFPRLQSLSVMHGKLMNLLYSPPLPPNHFLLDCTTIFRKRATILEAQFLQWASSHVFLKKIGIISEWFQCLILCKYVLPYILREQKVARYGQLRTTSIGYVKYELQE